MQISLLEPAINRVSEFFCQAFDGIPALIYSVPNSWGTDGGAPFWAEVPSGWR